MRTVLFSCIVLCLLCCSCSHENRRRHVSDGHLQIHLSRDFVRAHSTVLGDADIELEAKDSENLAAALVARIAVEFLEIIIEGMLDAAPSTRVVVWPKGYRKTYRQRLYWGNNDFYYPAECAQEHIPIMFKVKGDRVALKEIHVPLQRQAPATPIKIETSMLQAAE